MTTIAEALNLGRQQHQAGNLAVAMQVYQQILRADANQPEAWYLLAAAYQALGQLADAEAGFRQVLRLQPNHSETHNALGIVLSLSGRHADAVACFEHTLRLQPNNASAYNNLGNVLRELGRFADAEAACRAALRLRPGYPEAYNNLGNALKDQSKYDEALASLREAIRLRPNYARAYNNLGATLAAMRRYEEALRYYQEALRLQPDFFQAVNNLGVTYAELRQFDQAIAWYKQAVRLRPDFADAYNNMGIAYQDLWQLDEALPCYEQAIRLRPSFPDPHNQLGMVHMAQGRVPEAIAYYLKALELKPADPKVHSNLLLCLNYLPDLDPAELFAEHRRWNERHGQVERLGPLPDHDRNPDRRLRIGYVSPDLRKHAVAYFFEAMLANHDPQQVETFCYAYGSNPDAMTAHLQTLAHSWRTITHLTDKEAVAQIQADGIDILVDLAGHAGNKRLQLFAYKPAPVQVTHLGYPNTTGLKSMDYRLTDAVADPPGEPVRHTEELVRLPGCFSCYTPPAEAPAVSPLRAPRKGHFTFGSIHGLPKLNDRVFDAWSELLRRVPTSRLLVHRSVLTGRTRDELLAAFTRRGIPAERIELGHEPDPQVGFLKLYEDIDLCLDAFPSTGHTTVCEALWMGVPVVTLRGDRFAGRVTASVLTAAGLTEFIAETPEQYLDLAARWAADVDRLAERRAGLREQVRRSALCDGRQFTRGLEEAYRAMWRRWCAS